MVMAGDLLASLEDLELTLKEMKTDTIIAPHEESVPDVSPEETEASPYCIKNGSYVKISQDNMQAWVCLYPPKEGEDYYDRDLIVQFLQENKVVSGYHNSNISAIAKKHVYEREILVAQGKKAVEGSPGYFEFFFDTSDKRKPTIREDGTADYTSMTRLSNVKAGDLVARYHHATPNENGFDVKGKETKSKPGKELVPLKCRNVSHDKNPDEYVADVTGKIDYRAGKIDIKNVHEVRGDVDLIEGKIEFYGDIHIQGNVGAGVIIRASRNILIEGVVESAEIYAGGDVVITKGIQGGQKGIIAAKGNVSAEFIEHSTVEAGGNVRSNSFINANVYSEEMVVAEGKNGLILGGNVRGLKGVSATVFGNEMETKTFVASGYSEDEYQKYLDAHQRENEVQANLSEVVERMTEILKKKRLGNDFNSELSERNLADLAAKKDKYFAELDKVRQEKEALAIVIEKGKGSVILANEKIFRGVTICVEGTAMKIPANTSYMKYKNEAGKIVPSVITVH